ncbi:uncharacterized protein LOC129919231 [Episyrphus balteatus]|uniref:uncharacterized protein LOC129919231 n=1 Tax=Episyrphus balteatus TaxID=286459 RepID=UPI002484FF6D|nr:uncharacterized protein LOC129919231 [Episyrphus balteatus]
MINVIAVFQDFGTSSTIYSYSNFGEFKIEEVIWSQKTTVPYFRDHMQDLNGSSLPILFGGSEPALIISENSKEIEISGAGVKVPVKWFSYPYTVFDWSVMLPVEPKVPIFKLFAFIFHWNAFLITILTFILLSVLLEAAKTFQESYRTFTMHVDFFFNMDCFRGILGKSFTEAPKAFFTTKIIYLLIFLLGIMIVTSYDAFLQSFMTKLPRENIIKSWDDLQSSGLKVYQS